MTIIEALSAYRVRMDDAIARQLHHDQRRAILLQLLRDGFGIDVEEVELERNVRVAQTRGRIDLLYRDVVFEVKRDLTREHAEVLRELQLYLAKLGHRSFAVATDGLRFEAYRLANEEIVCFDELDLDRADDEQAASWIDSYLFAAANLTPTAEDVVRRFGPRSPVFLAACEDLAELWAAGAGQPAAQIKRTEWDRLLRVVYGSAKGSDDLFIRHTYLALVARLLAFLAIARQLPSPGNEGQIITGDAFRRLGVENLVQEDFFAWVADHALIGSASSLLAKLARHLSVYATDKIDEDLLKQLYETLVDPVDRHDLGEYYTPDWLADLALEEGGYGPNIRVLDPACGSGTFLFSAVRRLRASGLSGAELVAEAESNIAGFDVHPLAVTVARANFVLALRQDAIMAGRSITVPVWMADSLAVPEQSFGRPIEISVPRTNDEEGRERFVLPTEMEDARPGSLSEAATLVAEFSRPDVSDDNASAGFAAALGRLGVSEFAEIWQSNLALLRRLVREGRDTVWSFVLSNAARPQMVARAPVDLIVGNPPWLPLRDISEADYRERVTQLAIGYGLLSNRRGWQTGALELATVFACFSLDRYLRPHGRLAFVLPRGVLWGAKQHDNFRRAAVQVPMKPVSGFDLEAVHPLFNVPACLVVAERTQSPEPRWTVSRISGTLPRRNASRVEADQCLAMGPAAILERAGPGQSHYLDQAIQGATIAPRPFWFVEVTPETAAAQRRWVVTDHEASTRAKKPWTGISLEGQIEAEFVFATALEIFPYRIGPPKICVLPIKVLDGRVCLLTPDEVLRTGAPGLHAWLAKSEQLWSQRKKDSAAQNVEIYEYLDNHRNLTRQRPGGTGLAYGAKGSHVRAAVVDADSFAAQNRATAFLVDMNMYWVRTKTTQEAHYLAALLNTPFVDAAIKAGQTRGAWGARDIHRRPFENVPIPLFNPFDDRHLRLAELSEQAHTVMGKAAISRTYQKQLGPVSVLVAEADSLARQVCVAGKPDGVLG